MTPTSTLRLLALTAALLPLTQPTLPTFTATAWHRPSNAAPIITPNPSATFGDDFHPGPVQWEALHTFNPAAIVRNNRVYLLYRAEDNTGTMAIGGHTSRLGLAVSDDGLHFTQNPQPVLFPAHDAQQSREWPGGVEDPRLVEREDGTYILTYTQYNRITYDIGLATSTDLIHWTKQGPVFQYPKYAHLEYKSGGILTHLQNGRLVAAKVNGHYLMYWGERQIRLATSPDAIHWTPVEDKSGNPVIVLQNHPGHFDSAFPEVGPPPLLDKGTITLIYNGKNASTDRDPTLAPDTYATGTATFSANAPQNLLTRSDQPFLKPELPFERTGQYTAGTTFAEGLVSFKGQWLLYYGCADSFVGVALSQP